MKRIVLIERRAAVSKSRAGEVGTGLGGSRLATVESGLAVSCGKQGTAFGG